MKKQAAVSATFKFRGIAAKWEAVRAKDLNIDPDEVLVVNSEGYIGNLMDESVLLDSPSPWDMVRNNIWEMRPNCVHPYHSKWNLWCTILFDTVPGGTLLFLGTIRHDRCDYPQGQC